MTGDLAKLASLAACVAGARDTEAQLDAALSILDGALGLSHVLIFVLEEELVRAEGSALVLLASRGYERSGVGAEVRLGQGVIGMAAARRTSLRLGNVSQALRYARAAAVANDQSGERVVPMPGLPDVQSQMAVPLCWHNQLLGVISAESRDPSAFGAKEQQLLEIVAAQLAAVVAFAQRDRDVDEAAAVADDIPRAEGDPLEVRRYDEDDSVFLDGDYLIKGLPGRLLWRLLTQHEHSGRTEFTTKEMRLDPFLQLPAGKDNLDTRLILLRRRLEERTDALRIIRAARGRIRLEKSRPLVLVEVKSTRV